MPAGGRGHRHRQHPGHARGAGRRGSARRSSPPPSSESRGNCLSAAARTATAMARSKCGPRLGRSAGRQQDRGAARVGPVEAAVVDRGPAPVAGLGDGRRRAGPRARSRRGPAERSTWTSTTWPIAPCSETVCVVATHQPTPRTCSTTAAPRRPAAPRPGRSGCRRGGRRARSTQRAASRRSRGDLGGASPPRAGGRRPPSCGSSPRRRPGRRRRAGPGRSRRASHRQLRSTSTMPSLGQTLRGDPFAVGTEGLLLCVPLSSSWGQHTRPARRRVPSRGAGLWNGP